MPEEPVHERRPSVSAIQGPLNPSLLKLKLLDCLRNDYEDKLNQLVTEARESNDEQVQHVCNLLLHFAVQVAPLKLIRYIVKEGLVPDVNIPDEDGNTPLHLAAMNTRADVIKYLMDVPSINDCILNHQGKQPYESSSDMSIVQLLSDLRHRFIKAKASEFKIAFDSRDFQKLDLMTSQQRVRDYLDINGINPITGDTVLIEFIKKNDFEMVEFILNHGGDPFKRNLNGKLPIELTTSAEMKKLVKRSSNEQTMIDNTGATGTSPVSNAAPTFKGFLKKWTNFAGGYKLRWFILDEEGKLSYYKSPNDIENTCRGVIHLSRAQLRMDSSEKSKFEIIIYNKTGPPVKWHLKANHIIETNRWVWTLQNAIRYAKDREMQKRAAVQAERVKQGKEEARLNRVRQSIDTNRSMHSNNSARQQQQLAVPSSPNSSLKDSYGGSGNDFHGSHRRISSAVSSVASFSSTDDEIPSADTPKKSRISRLKNKAKETLLPGIGEVESRNAKPKSGSSESSVNDIARGSAEPDDFGAESYMMTDDELDDDDDEEVEEDEVPVGLVGAPNTEQASQDLEDVADDATRVLAYKRSEVVLLQNQMKIQIESAKEFLLTSKTDSTEKEFVCNTGLSIIDEMDTIFRQQSQILNKKEAKLNRVFERHHEISSIWERAIKDLEYEIAAREQKIITLENKVSSIKKILKPALTASSPEQIEQILLDLTQQTHTPTNEPEKNLDNIPHKPSPLAQESIVAAAASHSTARRPSAPVICESANLIKLLEEDEDSDGEFFDATDGDEESIALEDIEASRSVASRDNTIEEDDEGKVGEEHGEEKSLPTHSIAGNKVDVLEKIDESEGTEDQQHINEEKETVEKSEDVAVNGYPVVTETQKSKLEVIEGEHSFKGYEDPIRESLGKTDDRPKISLWGILKSLVGKDMTKMTLPVSFNEPTSLLQRVAEDMEYADLLDKAAKIEDSTLRMVYVAAYAASEYASTIGRIAKPFNPLLGETYEYARPDKGYRFFIEQVSHHPPIGAAYAESPFWDYYGESNVKSKFLGRSFDIRPLGTWFLNLRPSSGVIDKRGKKVTSELYTWKKVISSVVGIIMGNPTVDNYGDMNIINHTTGDSLVLSFKQRGWRASSAYEVKGEVKNGKGVAKYAVFGHWDSVIYARRISSSSNSDSKNPKFIIWQANKRTEMIFNLTNFAASLNAPQPSLIPVLPSTDTRLRPDQRAMEVGEYDKAAVEKNRVEEKQRAAKRERDAKGEEYNPSFFSKKVHPVTGDDYWEPNGKYWQLRDSGKLKDYKSIF